MPVVPSWVHHEGGGGHGELHGLGQEVAPAARAAVRFAVTESPAPTMSISPRTGCEGTCSAG